MTTIAYKEGIIAYDSRVTTGSVITNPNFNKLFVVDDVHFFMSGCVADVEKLIDIYFKRAVHKNISCTALVVVNGEMFKVSADKDGELWREKVERDNPFVLGSGSPFALTAMDMGADSIKAVEMAALRDVNTGGQIRTYTVH